MDHKEISGVDVVRIILAIGCIFGATISLSERKLNSELKHRIEVCDYAKAK